MASLRSRRGWTLLELLIVLLLVAIVAGRATMSLGAVQGRALASEGERLAALLTSARDESVLAHRVMRVRLSQAGYRFETEKNGRSVELASDDLFRPRVFPAGIRLENAQSTEPREGGETLLVFTPWGEDSAFDLLLTDGKQRARVRGDGQGIYVQAAGV